MSARYAPAAVLAMAGFMVGFAQLCRYWPVPHGPLLGVAAFLAQPMALALLAIVVLMTVAGGMFVVPLYAFLTTFVPKNESARTIAANNIVNSAAMVIGAAAVMAMNAVHVPIIDQIQLCAAMCVLSAWCGQRLFRAECAA